MLESIAFIPDGNRRWAKERNLSPIRGHMEGFENIKRFCEWSRDSGVKALTAFGFSTENWNRPKGEVKYLMKLLEKGFSDELAKYKKKDKKTMFFMEEVRIKVIGQKEKLSSKLQKVIARVEEMTSNNDGFVLNLAVSYSGRWDILQVVQRMLKDNISPNKLNEALFNDYLSTASLPDPDLIIRTGKVKRLSNFLLWQAAYSELYFSDKYWPEFNKTDFRAALDEYSRRQRRFGR